ncbi:MAG: hypothetical protein HY826_02760, partial [Actinobacteria bacterium]|nr:hypothetical protein [Actinomycetota bacterium]
NLDYDNISFTGCGTPLPAPSITKSFSPDPIITGATSTLTFTISNTAAGNQALTGVAFTDALPTGLSIPDTSSTQCGGGTLTTVTATQTITLTGGSLSSGAVCSFDVVVTGTTDGQHDNVTGFVSSNESGTSTDYATDSLMVISPPVLAKSFSPSSILTGDTSTLSFAVTNPNPLAALTGIAFSDALPAGLTVASTGPTSVCGGTLTTTSPDGISFGGGSLAANSSCVLDITVTGATSGTKLNTTGAVTSAEGGDGNVATATLIVQDPIAIIDLNKQVSTDNTNWFKFASVPAGGDVYYRFTVYNAGDTAFSAVSVSDPTLAATAVDPAACVWSTPVAPGDTLYCVRGPIAAVNGSHPNTASASGVHVSGSETSAPSTATYATPGLSIVKSAGEVSFGSVGDVLHYTYLVTNSGSTPLLGPATVSDDKSTDESCPAVDTIGDLDNYLDPDESITCFATYTVQAADVSNTSVTNIASATVGGFTSATDSVTVPLQVPVSAIAVVKTASPTTMTAAGQTIDYSFLVTNTGDVTLTAVAITDPLPGLSAITCPTTTLAPAGSTTCTATYIVSQDDIDAGSITNSATATGTPPVGGPVEDSDSTTVSAALSPQITVIKATNEQPYTAVGEVLTFTVTATNTGNVTLSNVVVVDQFAILGSCSITAPITLAPASSVTCTATHSTTQVDLDRGFFDNYASASGTTPQNVIVSDDSNVVTVPDDQLPSVSITKATTSTSFSFVGQQVPYTITASNTGNVTLTGVTISDPNAAIGVCTPVAPTTLAPGQSLSCAAVHTVTQADLDRGSISNTARVDGDSGVLAISGNSNTVVITRGVVAQIPSAGSDSYAELSWAAILLAVGSLALLATKRRPV